MESISGTIKKNHPWSWINSYAALRSDGYALLASLLQGPPSEVMMEILMTLYWDAGLPEKLENAFAALKLAGQAFQPAAVQKEYNRLFIGLGCGRIIPYESWYTEKKIQSAPLAALRADLMHIGIVRQADWHDSEDHAGALCEIMAIITRKQSGIDYVEQTAFFNRHITPWMMHLFSDIEEAANGAFYRSAGRFGGSFLETESVFLPDAAKNHNFTGEGE
ncbi:MAG: hypothetical protein CVU71_16570 [Deltaproteobacteria bacterium HGW-Deltaproteobacteria-6]|jgi:TorA maturation chaperone TorD|nr:MAG: hypothetical protein CVU71_16570 [Deltaproteobacteria bacterium HGW-Deltaproteobacteria-6]